METITSTKIKRNLKLIKILLFIIRTKIIAKINIATVPSECRRDKNC